MYKLSVIFLLVMLTLSVQDTIAMADPDYAWIEGESPTSISPSSYKPEITDVGTPQYLSGGKWIHVAVNATDIATMAPDGITLTYDFTVAKSGANEVWARIGYQASRTAFDWRIDNTPWQTVSPGAPFVEVQQLQTWNDVSWMRLGDESLSTGQHTFQFRLYKTLDSKGQSQNIQFALDALCISAEPFFPNDRYRPDDLSWQTDLDRSVESSQFQLPSSIGQAQTSTDLIGLWQMARYEEGVVHDPDGPIPTPTDENNLSWKAISVPGDVNAQHPEWLYAHRFLLRTRLLVPSTLTGRSFVLHFPSLSMLATVFVNGHFCGFDNTPFAAWDCDISNAVLPGQVNEIAVGIKDWYYALPDNGAVEGATIKYIPTDWVTKFGPANFTYPIWNHTQTGILATPSVVVGGRIYTSDVFCQPSVQKKALDLDITIHNSTDSSATVQVSNKVSPLTGGAVALVVPPVSVTVPAGADSTADVLQPWSNPKIWWPDDPEQYVVTTTITEGGDVIDQRNTKFGFREWTWSGDNFALNGVPFHGRADTSHLSDNLDDTWLKNYQTHGQDMIRDWEETSDDEAHLDWYDAHGINVRRTGIFDGEAARYNVNNQELWTNYRLQLAAWIKGQRNHPSIFIWSVENEVTFINGHVYGEDQVTTQQHHLTAQVVTSVDPTRPFMVDGGNALLDESFPVYGGHYIEPPFESLPDGAYDKAGFAHRQVWPITQHKPIFLGEAYYWNGNDPGDFATTGGDSAFLGKEEAAPAIGLTGKMLSEGYRWNDINFEFWGGDTSDLYYNSWQPLAALCREWDSSFLSATSVPRTLKIFNDTRFSAPIVLNWTLTFDGKITSSGAKTYSIAPGTNVIDSVLLPMPKTLSRMDGDWTVTLSREGTQVFRDVKPISVLPVPKLTEPVEEQLVDKSRQNLAGITVYDPTNVVPEFLKTQRIAFSLVNSLDTLPPSAKVLVIGAGALTQAQSASGALSAYASAGRVVIVLEQTNPLKFQAVPATMDTSTVSGEIAFAQNLDDPLFEGLEQSDFFTWGADGTVYQNAYRKPTSSATSLVECGFRLQDSALTKMSMGKGFVLLSQLTIGEKLRSNVVAQTLLLNMISVGLTYKQTIRPVLACAGTNPILVKTLDAIGVTYSQVDSVLAAIGHPGAIAVIDATPANLLALSSVPETVSVFTNAGGWIILNNLTPDGIGSFDKLVGVSHIIRRFGQNATNTSLFGEKHIEKVVLTTQSEPLLAGLSPSDVVFESGQQIFSYEAGQLPDEDGYSYVVDIGDIAPFATSPWGMFGNITNGFTQEDGFWPLIVNFPAPADGSPYQIPINLARPETLVRFSYAQDLNYLTTTKISLLFDGRNKQSFDLLPNGDTQTFAINPPQTASQVTLEIDDWIKDPTKAANLGVDNIWLYPQRSPDFDQKVRPLMNIGALVEYPHGSGGIVLCNVEFKDSESNPENVNKKQAIITTILRNLSAPFSRP